MVGLSTSLDATRSGKAVRHWRGNSNSTNNLNPRSNAGTGRDVSSRALCLLQSHRLLLRYLQAEQQVWVIIKPTGLHAQTDGIQCPHHWLSYERNNRIS